jgi:hypothetical protein
MVFPDLEMSYNMVSSVSKVFCTRFGISGTHTQAGGCFLQHRLVHSDVFRFVLVPSLGKFVYYLSFINDFLRNTWIYFLQKKSEVFGKFKEFKALMEN